MIAVGCNGQKLPELYLQLWWLDTPKGNQEAAELWCMLKMMGVVALHRDFVQAVGEVALAQSTPFRLARTALEQSSERKHDKLQLRIRQRSKQLNITKTWTNKKIRPSITNLSTTITTILLIRMPICS